MFHWHRKNAEDSHAPFIIYFNCNIVARSETFWFYVLIVWSFILTIFGQTNMKPIFIFF